MGSWKNHHQYENLMKPNRKLQMIHLEVIGGSTLARQQKSAKLSCWDSLVDNWIADCHYLHVNPIDNMSLQPRYTSFNFPPLCMRSTAEKFFSFCSSFFEFSASYYNDELLTPDAALLLVYKLLGFYTLNYSIGKMDFDGFSPLQTLEPEINMQYERLRD